MSNTTVPGQIELLTPDFNFKGYWDSIIFIVLGHGISKAELPVLAGCNESIDCNFLSTGQEAELLIKMSLILWGLELAPHTVSKTG